MRIFVPTAAVAVVSCLIAVRAPRGADEPITPAIELQSGPLTPGLVLDESPRPVHQIRLVVDARLQRGMLILDGNLPQFDEFGGLVGGIQTPHVRGKGEQKLIAQCGCTIKLIKTSADKWHLYRVESPHIRTPLRIATRGSIDEGGPARVVFLRPDGKVRAVIDCTRYGLVIP